MMRLGLRGQFNLLLLATALALLAVFAIGALTASRAVDAVLRQNEQARDQAARQALAERGGQLAGLLADALTNPIYYTDLLAMREVVRSALVQPDVRYVRVYDRLGRVLHDGSEDIPGYGQPMDDPLATSLIGATTARVQWDATVVDAAAPVAIGELLLGGVRVGLALERMDRMVAQEAAAARERMQQGVTSIGQMLLLGLSVLILWVVLAGEWLRRRLVRPIRRLAALAVRIENGEHVESGLGTGRQDEVGDLARAFDHMSLSLMRHHAEIHQLAYGDTLTGLPNRRMFRQLLDEAVSVHPQTGIGFALLFADVDDFKRINDTLGHDAGDQVLVELVRRLERALLGASWGQGIRARLARLGGDEFVALVSAADTRSAGERVAAAMLAQLQQPFQVAGKSLRIGLSIGLTRFPEDGLSSRLLLKQGDLAMYQAKQQGKQRFQFYSGQLTEVAEQRLELESELRHALAAGTLDLHYQPIHRFADQRLVGAEALLRWRHPTHGLVPPSVFIPVAERCGLADELGDWVIGRSIRDCAAWQAELPGIWVAVNVSGRQLQRPLLASVLSDTLAEHRLAAALVHVELTESSLVHDEEQAFALLGELRESGVEVWLDDFGTGFSALSHLRRARVDGVKIDRSFVADILRDSEDLALCSAIIAMAHSLGIGVVAEGVENEAQWTLLRERGCDMAQGFLMSPAVSAEALLQTAKAASARSPGTG